MTDFEIGWVAGIIDGEGCIQVRVRPNGQSDLMLAIANTDYLMLKTLRDLTGVGSIYQHPRPTPAGKIIWHWTVATRAARQVLRCVEAHLVAKREQALVALAMPVGPRGLRSTEAHKAAAKAVRLELMRLHREPHLPVTADRPSFRLMVAEEQVALPLLTVDDRDVQARITTEAS